MITTGGDLQQVILADQLLTGVGQLEINMKARAEGNVTTPGNGLQSQCLNAKLFINKRLLKAMDNCCCCFD
jgi:hypothetical protein